MWSNRGSAVTAVRSAATNANDLEAYDVKRVPLPDGFPGGIAIDVNNRGTVAGMLFAGDGKDQTFIWNSGDEAVRVIRHPDAEITAVASITDSGLLFGNWGSFEEQVAGFHNPTTGQWKELPAYPGKKLNFGQRANNAGFANGNACNGTWDAPDECVWWIWDGKEYKAPALPGGLFVVIEGLNEIGQIAGRRLLSPPFNFRSFILDGATSKDILQGVKSSAYDINNRGDVVLNYEAEPNTLFVPAVWSRKGDLTALPLFPGAFGTTYIGLNDRGDFVGLAYDAPTDPRDSYPVVALSKSK
jgi:uncharacterized membrane protein